MKLQNGQIINVQAYKKDGTLYRQWNGVSVIEISPELWVLFMYKTKVTEISGSKWVVREPMIWWMPRDQFFNTSGLLRKTGTFFYINLSSIPIFEDNTIKFIDYDLDIKYYPNLPLKILDKKEYEKHKVKFNYSKKLQTIISKTLKKIIKQIKNKEFVFDQDVVERYKEELSDMNMISSKFLKKKWKKQKKLKYEF